MGPHQITVRVQYMMKSRGDGWVLVGPAAFKAVVRRAERLGCVRFTRISASFTAPFLRTALFVGWPQKPTVYKKTREGTPFLVLLCGFYSFSRSSNSVFDISRYSAERPRASTHTRASMPAAASSSASKRIDMPQPADIAHGVGIMAACACAAPRAASDAIAACVDSNAIT